MRRSALLLLLSAALALLSLAPLSAQIDIPRGSTSPLQVVDSTPLPGEALGLRSPITVYFDRDINCATTGRGVTLTPSAPGAFSCDGTALTFTPSADYARNTPYTLTINEALQANDSAQLREPYTLTLTTIGYLQVSATLPTDGATEAVADTVLTVIFNRPVVPLGLPSDAPDAPSPIQIIPAIGGEGKWLNTAIYTFTPTNGWGGGTTYTVTVADVTAQDGATLEQPFMFSFTVALPAILTTEPAVDAVKISLLPRVYVTYNQAIDRASLEANFTLSAEDTPDLAVNGTFIWDEGDTGFTFISDAPLRLDTLYSYGYAPDSVNAANSDATLPALNSLFRTAPLPAIVSTYPSDGLIVEPYGGFELFFASPMDPATLNDKITISPAPILAPEFYYRSWSDSLSVSFSAEPDTAYTISIAPGMADIYGNTIETPFAFSYTTGDYPAELALKVPNGPIGFYDAGRDQTSVFITHRNIERVNLELYQLSLVDFLTQLTGADYYSLSYEYQPRSAALVRSWSLESVAPPNVLRYDLLDLGNPAQGTSNAGAMTRSLPPGSPSVECPGALPTRTKIGDQAQVIVEPDPLRARSFPPDGEIVDLLYKGYAFEVIEGPICANDLLWWSISLREGGTAWVAESVGDEYFFEVTIPGQGGAPDAQPAPSTIELDGGTLPVGVYLLDASSNETVALGYNDLRHFMVVGSANLTLKAGIDSASVWATDVHSGAPLPNVPIALYGISDVTIGATTDALGVATFNFPRRADLYAPLAVLLDDGVNFGIGFSGWEEGIDLWRFNVNYSYYPQRYVTYLYTERPVYRPGQP
ncbi:MAG: Ig-like domain-containing protein, partial [Armatimonadetes bacterium]|nr:Ig-like domain-containing protein [Anaerolineae bacterium]